MRLIMPCDKEMKALSNEL